MSAKHILTCVTSQRSCERLIRQSASFAKTLGCDVTVLHVASGQNLILGNENQAEALEYLYQISREYGADMSVLRAEDVIETIVGFAKKKHITHVVLGGPAATRNWQVPEKLRSQLPGAEFYVIPSDVAPGDVHDMPIFIYNDKSEAAL